MSDEIKFLEREQYGQQIGEKRGKKEAALKYLKQYVKDLRDFGVSEDAILEHVLESYSSDLSPKEIRAIVKAK